MVLLMKTGGLFLSVNYLLEKDLQKMSTAVQMIKYFSTSLKTHNSQHNCSRISMLHVTTTAKVWIPTTSLEVAQLQSLWLVLQQHLFLDPLGVLLLELQEQEVQHMHCSVHNHQDPVGYGYLNNVWKYMNFFQTMRGCQPQRIIRGRRVCGGIFG